MHRRARAADGASRHLRHDPPHRLRESLSFRTGAGRSSCGVRTGAVGVRRQLRRARCRAPCRARAASARPVRRRLAHDRSRQRRRSGRRRQSLCGPFHAQRRPLPRRRGALARAVERWLARCRARGLVRGGRGRRGARTMVRRCFPSARLSHPARLEARLSPALSGRGQCDAGAPRHRCRQWFRHGADGERNTRDDRRRVRAPGCAQDARAARSRRDDCTRHVSAGRGRRSRALARPPSVPAGHAAGHWPCHASRGLVV